MKYIEKHRRESKSQTRYAIKIWDKYNSNVNQCAALFNHENKFNLDVVTGDVNPHDADNTKIIDANAVNDNIGESEKIESKSLDSYFALDYTEDDIEVTSIGANT